MKGYHVDSLRNLLDRGECCINIISDCLIEQVHGIANRGFELPRPEAWKDVRGRERVESFIRRKLEGQ